MPKLLRSPRYGEPRNTVNISISILPQLLERLNRMAAENGRSRSGELNWLIAQEIKRKKLKKDVAIP